MGEGEISQTPAPPRSGCGCGGTTSPRPPRPQQDNSPTAQSAPAPAFREVQQRAALCYACPHSRNDSWCAKAQSPLFSIITTSEPTCPINAFPTHEGKTRLYGLTYYGVPLPVRQLIEEEAAKRGKTTTTKRWDGCGCLARLKDATEWLATHGESGTLVAGKIDTLAQSLSPLVARLMAFHIFARASVLTYLERIGVRKPSPAELQSRTDNGRYIVAPSPKGTVDTTALGKVVQDAARVQQDVAQAVREYMAAPHTSATPSPRG